jgi:hypothetical protein
MKIEHDFFNDIPTLSFKPMNYTLYNIMEDDYFVDKLNKLDNTKYSIDDFEYASFPLSDKEKYLIKMWNGEYMENIKELKEKIKDDPYCSVYINHEGGFLMFVRLIKNND